MKNLTVEEKVLLRKIATEIKSVISDEQDYEGASVKRMIDSYVKVCFNPSNTIKEKTIYHCKTPTDSIAFLNECQENGIFILTDACTEIGIDHAIDLFEKYYEGTEFLLAPTGDKVLMGTDLKKYRESLPVVEFTATKGAR